MQGLFEFWRSEVEKILCSISLVFPANTVFSKKKKSYSDHLKGKLEHK